MNRQSIARVIGLCVAGVGLFFFSAAARAEDDSARLPGPAGSYRDTCRNAFIRGDDLIAECRTSDGERERTTLHEFRRCAGDIVNDYGRLRCEAEDRQGRDARGDDRAKRDDSDRTRRDDKERADRDARRNDRAERDDEARARREARRAERAAEDRARREARRAERDARRRDDRAGRDETARITLYESIRFGGDSRSFSDDRPWVGDFSDLASSAKVEGGRWQLCTRTNYRGRCVTVDADVASFTTIGVNDRVESLRRVR